MAYVFPVVENIDDAKRDYDRAVEFLAYCVAGSWALGQHAVDSAAHEVRRTKAVLTALERSEQSER